MNKYVYSLLIISLVGGIVNSLIDNFKDIKRYVNYFLSLIMVICMISPITSVLGNINTLKDSVSNFFNELTDNELLNGTNEIIINTGTDAIIKGIKNTIIEKFDFDESEIIVSLETDTTNIEAIKITKINVILTGKASWYDVDTVKTYLENIVGGEISVTRR